MGPSAWCCRSMVRAASTGLLAAVFASAASPQIDIDLPSASPAEALRAVADAAHLSLITAPATVARRPFRLESATLDAAVGSLSAEYGLDVAVWRGILIAEAGDPTLTPAARLRASLTPEEAELLFRAPDDGSYDAPGFELIVAAVKALAKEGHTEANRALLERAALWRAAPELQQHLANLEEAQAGEVLAAIAPPAQWEKDRGDPCDSHLVLHYTGSGDPRDVLETQTARFHGPGYDRFVETLKQERATIDREELVRRLLAKARAEEDPLGVGEAWQLPASTEYTETSLASLVERLGAGSGLRIAVEADLGNTPLVAALREIPLGEALQAAARLGHSVALPTPEGCTLAAPVNALERLGAALPVHLWGLANLTSIEADLWCQEHTEAAWAALSPEMRRTLTDHPVPLRELPDEIRPLPAYRVARDLRRWFANLPLRDGPVPLWLYEWHADPRFANYELRAPGGSEAIAGMAHLALRGELSGETVLTIPAPAQEGGHRE
jgi:hypothetical protein